MHVMRVNGQQVAFVMSTGSSDASQSGLKGLGFDYRVSVQQFMDGLVTGQKRQPVGQFKPFLAQTTRFADTRNTQGRFMDELKSQSGVNLVARAASPSRKKVPGSQSQMLWNQEPDAHEGTGDFVGQPLTYTALDARPVTGFLLSFAFRLLGLNQRTIRSKQV